ncbi:MAG: 3-deoxy-D-manno-octulosonic acid transferase [Pseudomonadota bacterium]
MSAALAVYLAASRLLGPLAPVLLQRRLVRGKEDGTRLGERLGRTARPRPDGRLVWVHAASVGEAVSALPLIDAILAQSDAHVLMTTGTVTSAQRMAGNLPERAIHQYVPVDTAAAVTAFLSHWRPDMGIWIESELWPRLVVETARRRVPMAMINARLSARSAARWGRARAMASGLFGRFDQILTQDTETIDRLATLGVDAAFAGNLKALAPVPEPDPDELNRLQTVLAGRPVWLAASTHRGEEEIILAAHERVHAQTGAVLILAPRHPERGDEIMQLVASPGNAVWRRSGGEQPSSDHSIYVADTLGEMGLWYRLAPVTLVGGSLVDRGGHTPFEPTGCNSAVVHGPHVANFAPAYRALSARMAAVNVDPSAEVVASAVQDLLMDAAARAEMIKRAQEVHSTLKPDVDTLATDLLSLMEDQA